MTKNTNAQSARRPARARSARATGLTMALTLALFTSAVASVATEPFEEEATVPHTSVGGEVYRVTLITGDVVEWQVSSDGPSAIVRDEGEMSVFQTIQEGDDYYVIPSDVASLVGSTLDRELFNIAGLVEQGYHDDAVNGVPVILDSGSTAGMRQAASAPGLSGAKSLPSAQAVAGNIGKGQTKAFGSELAKAARKGPKKMTPATVTADPLAAQPAAEVDTSIFDGTDLEGVETIWLDAKVSVALEESVPQTGAPQAWTDGYDGTGMLIAVLDTGIDPDHPDVAGKIVHSQDFSGSGNVVDHHGHGTHVAATAAGSGDASDGLRKGVAPGADLAIGKVLDDSGGGSTSGIIAGMEWAANLEGVDVISMSLGGGPGSDGTDPASQAVNRLTEEHGVLFTIAAGNDGPGPRTIGYPGTADAALTVGAVDKSHNLASFSSRGPRRGDWAIKPEITAPGVGIKAARAAGTAMGTQIDQYYTSASGTSMATPHVAGAVALLKQKHPDWDPETLKSALVNTANPKSGLTPFQQGGGELSVPQSLDADVVAFPSTLNMGYFRYPHTEAEPVTKTVTYTNRGEQAQSLDLQAEIKNDKNVTVPAGMVSVSPAHVTIEPGASAAVEVTVDPAMGGEAVYGGSIIAVDADGAHTRTPVSFVVESEMYDLIIEGVQRNGQDAERRSEVSVLEAHDWTKAGRAGVPFDNGRVILRVPPGTYSVMAFIATESDDPRVLMEDQTLIGEPEIDVTNDTHVVLDAREATEIQVNTPYDKVTTENHSFQYHREDAAGHGFVNGYSGGDWPYYVRGTEEVSIGAFDFASNFNLSAPGVWMDLNHPEFGAIPANPVYEVNDTNVATVESSYHADVEGTLMRAHTVRNPWQPTGTGTYVPVQAPTSRTELYSANETRWIQTVNAPDRTFLRATETAYLPGQRLDQNWFDAPRTPVLQEGNEFTAGNLPTRTGDSLSLQIWEIGDANPGGAVHYGGVLPGQDQTAFRLYQDGELVKEQPRATGTVDVAPGDKRLRLELDVDRTHPFWTTSTKTRTAWEFDSMTTSSATALPLLQLDYDIDVDLTNTAVKPKTARGPFTIGLDVRQPYGVPSTSIAGVKAWLSYDEGVTWEQRPVKTVADGSYTIGADRRGGGGSVSIKVEAKDTAGNLVEQTITSAYKLRP